MGASEAPSHCNCDMNLMKSDGCQLSVNPAVRRFTIDGPHSNESRRIPRKSAAMCKRWKTHSAAERRTFAKPLVESLNYT